jgi:hypothetical protein
MPSTRTALRRRRRPRPSQNGFGALSLVLSTALLVLIAVLSIPAARLSGMAAGPAGAFDSGAAGAAASYPRSRTDAAPRDVRDPTFAASSETGRDMAPPALEPSVKVLALPDRGPDLSSLLGEGSVTLIGYATLLSRSGGWLELTATPTRPGPSLFASLTPPSMGVLPESGQGAGPASHRIWISGATTLERTLLDEFAARLTDLDIALLHLGGARPFGLVTASLDGADAARLVQRLAPRVVLPVPLDDFGDAPVAESVGRIVSGPVTEQGSRVRWLARGDMDRIAPSPRWASALDASLGP